MKCERLYPGNDKDPKMPQTHWYFIKLMLVRLFNDNTMALEFSQ